jgi:hypothetical protein
MMKVRHVKMKPKVLLQSVEYVQQAQRVGAAGYADHDNFTR